MVRRQSFLYGVYTRKHYVHTTNYKSLTNRYKHSFLPSAISVVSTEKIYYKKRCPHPLMYFMLNVYYFASCGAVLLHQ